MSALSHQSVARFLLVALLLVLPLLLHFKRNHQAGQLSQAGFETVQAARYLARTGKLRTLTVRPLETRYLRRPGQDGSVADLRHGPLHLGINAVVIKALRETKPGRGDRAAVLLQLALVALTGLATWQAGRRLFGDSGGPWQPVRAAFLFAFGGAAMSLALEPEPSVLASLWMCLLGPVLVALDGEKSVARTIRLSALAGALWGLMFLTLYSALVFLPVLAFYLFRVSRLRPVALGAFFLVATALALPVGFLSWREAGNPLYRGPLLELVMHTPTYPGESLYHVGSMPRSLPAYLADGGIKEVVRKLVRNLYEYIPVLLTTIGPLVALLAAMAGLLRFSDSRLNRLRSLAFGLLGAHVLGLALFFPPEGGAASLFVHVPLLALFASAALHIVVTARAQPAFFTQVALVGWSALACLPGVARFVAGTPTLARAPAMFEWLTEGAPQMRTLVKAERGLVASDIPAEVAFRHGIAGLLLPADSLELTEAQERLGLTLDGVFVSASLADGSLKKDEVLAPWHETQNKVIGYWNVVSDLPAIERGRFVREYALSYPAALRNSLRGYQPLPIAEPGTGRYSLVFWYNQDLDERSGTE
jgi:hypothetical protein